MERYLPEGSLIGTDENRAACAGVLSLRAAMENETVLEGIVEMCDSERNLIVSAGKFRGIIPRAEAVMGIDEGETREIALISRVGKPVAFQVMGVLTEGEAPSLLLSRRRVQQRALSFLLNSRAPGDIIPARVTHFEPFGAFVDIGCGIVSLIGIENLSVSRIAHPKNRIALGQDILAAVLNVDFSRGRLTLTHRELLGTWEQNAAQFSAGQTVRGIVRGVEDYGIFVELKPNLSGLAEFKKDVREGDAVSVFIKSVTADKMKIKLIIIDVLGRGADKPVIREDYFITSGRIEKWVYSPKLCRKKRIETDFTRPGAP